MYDDKTIEVYKKLLEYTANYCETNYVYYSKGILDYNIIISYKGNKLITLQHSTNMKRTVDDIATSIAKVITNIFNANNHYHKVVSENGNYCLVLSNTDGYGIKVVKT